MQIEVDYDTLSNANADEIAIIDIRDADSFEYGHILGAKNIPQDELETKLNKLSKDKTYYICCRTGNVSYDVAQNMRENGFKAYSLQNGYFGWLSHHISDLTSNEKAKEVEQSIAKKFHKELMTKFIKAIKTYDLIQAGDKIAVCISGGKDSCLMAKLFQALHRFSDIPFELVFLVMDPGYSTENRDIIEKNAQMLNIPITIFQTNIFENVFNIEKSPCYICARMRRGHLYNKAKELGCNKIALGHHYDDVIETILMGMLYGAQVQTMMPKLHSSNFEGMELIRPMYFIREDDIKRWRDYNNLHFLQCACKFTDTCEKESCQTNTGSMRKRTKMLIADLMKENPQIESNIFRSVENVNLSTIIAYKDEHGKKHSFLDNYDV